MTDAWELGNHLVQIALSIVAVGFLPGFALIQGLFPKADFDQIERFFLSVLSSLCTTSLLAYALTRTATGLTPRGLVLLSLSLTGICLLVSLVKVEFATGDNKWPLVHLNRENQILAYGSLFKVVGLVLLGITGLVFVTDLNSQPMPLTEFYVAPENLDADRVHYRSVPGGIVIPVEVVNREGRTVNYRLEARASSQSVGSAYQYTLRNAQAWSVDMSVPLQDANEADAVDLLLFEEKERILLLFFKVEEKALVAELRIWLAQ